MKNKKIIIPVIGASLLLAAPISILALKDRPISVNNAVTNAYVLVLDNKVTNNVAGDHKFKTSNGNELTLNLSNVFSGTGFLGALNYVDNAVEGMTGGSISLKYIESEQEHNRISGIQSIKLNINGGNKFNIRMSYGWGNQPELIEEDLNSVVNGFVYNFNNELPSYFKLHNIDQKLMYINSITVTYSCIERLTYGTKDLKYIANSDNSAYSVKDSDAGLNADKIVIPSSYNGKPVNSIAPSGFLGNDYIKSMYISDSVKEIGYSAFSNCSSLKNLKLPQKLNKIGEEAFSGCTTLDSIIVPLSVQTIEPYAFDTLASVKVYCEATEALSTWDAACFDVDTVLTTINVYYYSETSKPGAWHYNNFNQPVLY